MGMHEKTCANPLKEQRFFPSRQHYLAEVFRYLLTYLTYWSAGRANWPMRCSPKVICVHMFGAGTTTLRTYGRKWVCLRP